MVKVSRIRFSSPHCTSSVKFPLLSHLGLCLELHLLLSAYFISVVTSSQFLQVGFHNFKQWYECKLIAAFTGYVYTCNICPFHPQAEYCSLALVEHSAYGFPSCVCFATAPYKKFVSYAFHLSN